MSDLLSYEFKDNISTIVLDDGKVNAMSVQMLTDINLALDAAKSNGGVVILQGREGIFSGGFDLKVFKRGDNQEIYTMLKAGAELTERLLGFPLPVIAACTGHAIAMGAFILLSSDLRIGLNGNFNFAANEVAIGLTVPAFATEVCRQRLSPAALNLGLTLANYFDTESAKAAGFLDFTVDETSLTSFSHEKAAQLLTLDLPSHTATKHRLRSSMLSTLRQAIEEDCQGWRERFSNESD